MCLCFPLFFSDFFCFFTFVGQGTPSEEQGEQPEEEGQEEEGEQPSNGPAEAADEEEPEAEEAGGAHRAAPRKRSKPLVG